MNLEELLLEAEINKQYNIIGRFKFGSLSYIVKMRKLNYGLTYKDGTKETIEAVAPDVAISLFSAKKRELPERETDKKVGYLRRQVRKSFNDAYDKSYKLLSQEEAEKYGSKDAMGKVMDIIKSYFDKYNPDFVVALPYGDEKDRRMKFYELVLRKSGYKQIPEFPLFTKRNLNEITNATVVPTLRDKLPTVIKNAKTLASNI